MISRSGQVPQSDPLSKNGLLRGQWCEDFQTASPKELSAANQSGYFDSRSDMGVRDLLTWSNIFQFALYKCDQVTDMRRGPSPNHEAVSRIKISLFLCWTVKSTQDLIYRPAWEVFRQDLCLLLRVSIRAMGFISRLQLSLSGGRR